MNRLIGIFITKPGRHLLPALVAVAALGACATNRPPTAIANRPVDPGVADSAGPVPSGKAESVAPKYYVRTGRNGQTLYCQTLKLTGSRLPAESCWSQAELDQKTEKAQNFLNDSQRAALQQTPPSAH